jgi:2-methylfumaryl-CoA isomerase
MALAQLGAEVIRVDPIGGAADFHRWPVSGRTGQSLYWSALNKGKRSVAIDLRSPEGREIVMALAAAPGAGSGLVVDNYAGRTWLSYEAIAALRSDVIHAHIDGHGDGRAAVDYTVNAEVGLPAITGPENFAEPVNHVLPAWDLLTGMTAVTGLLAALYRRTMTGEGSYMRVALADVALAAVASMGWLAEAEERGSDRPRQGNYLYGSFGVDFTTSDQGHVMVVALTTHQWRALCTATGTAEVFSALETALSADLSDEADRYQHREVIAAVLRPWFSARTLSDVSRALDAARALWGQYRSMTEVVAAFRSQSGPTVLAEVDQPGIGTLVSARSPVRLAAGYGEALAAPRLGQHTDEVLAEVLGLDEREIAQLHARDVIQGECAS